MSTKKVGWCRITEELVLDVQILNVPYLRDDMDVYSFNGTHWHLWTPESQFSVITTKETVPEVVQVAMMMLS
jgi:hypothetical protein